ncbi:PIH1 domain-containing protein 2 [Camponotus floridanus]|uniref:PIH1 domain-containing protein 2 n=2 Tax=Camponotus floridanus TaxID=104421 RepID=E2A401_CAMFO|nr:probable serine/threonine-protein kinase DDB_G0280133 isoform X2 [Camponotus floridanus]EFN71853.1 PIH1 domain-containing protein 2 [Camponotus floridanus]
MTEGSVPRMKRNGARLFKNPPQPHMCIQDFIQGTTAPCYVNVLSWDKIAMPRKPSLPVPLYGGMRVPPPRTKTEAIVFAVMANPEVLRMSGKNAQDPKKRMSFIELLLDFVEAMNTGVFFSRHYTILKDRDITGELKEVWNAVLAIRDSEQRPPQQETWIDAQPSVSQYPQYPEQQQQQQEYTPQPPQYHSSIAYGRTISNENMHYDNYGHQPQSSIISKNEPIFISGPIMSQQYHGKVPQVLSLDRYNYRERGREDQIVQNIITAQHQFQPRQAWPQYVNTKYMHPNSNLPYGPATNTPPVINPPSLIKPFQPYAPYQQQQQQQPRMDNVMHIDMRRMQQQQQQQSQQMHLNTVQPQHEQPGSFNVQNNAHRTGRPHMGVVQKNNATKRQNSPMHTSCTNCQTKEDQSFTKPKSPVKVLQRETLMERQDITNHTENNKVSTEKTEESKTALVTDLNEDFKKDENVAVDTLEKEDLDNPEKAYTIDDPPPCEEKNPVKIDKPSETKETEASAMQQPTVQKNPNKFARNNAKTRKMMKNDKHNSLVSDSPKRSQPTMNSIIKSVFKINASGSGEETSNKRKVNGQTKTANGKTCENEEQGQGYTILKKEAQEEIVSEIAQISIQDCKDATEVGPVLS